MDTINWKRPLTFLLRGDTYTCAGGRWTRLSFGVPKHGAWARTPTYLPVGALEGPMRGWGDNMAEKKTARTRLFRFHLCDNFSRLII